MKTKSKWHVQYAYAKITKDSYTEGEDLNSVAEFTLENLKNKKFDSLSEIIKIINDYFNSDYTEKEFACFFGNKCPELVTDILIDYNIETNQIIFFKTIPEKYELWKQNKIILYNTYISIGLSQIYEKLPKYNDFKKENIMEEL
jgi:hypothetical protein